MKKIAIVLSALMLTFVSTASAARRSDDPTPPPPPPLNFAAELANFISLADDVTALRSWYENLTPGEQAEYAEQFNTAVTNLDNKETTLFDLVGSQLDVGNDSNLYILFETIKGMDPIKARRIFSSLTSKVSKRVNLDYVSSPSDPVKARRGRDMQAVRAFIGHTNS